MAGTPLGLMRVEYSIPAYAFGSFPLTIVTAVTDPMWGSIWGDSQFNVNIPLVVSGSITVASAPTPEPSSIVLLVLGAVGFAGTWSRRAHRSS